MDINQAGWFPGKGAINFLQGFVAPGESNLNAQSSWSGYMAAESTMLNMVLKKSARTVGIDLASKAEVLRDALHANIVGNTLGVLSIGLTFYEDSQRK